MRRLIPLVPSSEDSRRAFLLALLVHFLTFSTPAVAMQGHGGGENDSFSAVAANGGASLFTGAATVSIPILIPPGRTQTTPDLELNYSSHSGLSEAGLGWSLAIGSITRATRHGVPRCSGPHTEDFRVSLSASSNELVRVDSDVFQFRIDEAYAEVTPDVAANSWSLETRDGLTYRFGESESSRVHTGVDTFFDASSGCEFTTAWHLTRIEDANGNYIAIDYEQDGNIPIPSRIEYGGNSEVPIDHPFRVRIETEELPAGKPRMRRFDSGVDQSLRRRIKTIVVEARESASSDFAEVRRYGLRFDDPSAEQEFLLASLSTTGLPDRRFSYSTSTPTITTGKSGSIPTDPTLLSRQFPTGPIISIRDMNGDGLMDRVRVVGHTYRVSYGERGSGNQFTPQEYSWEMPPGSEFSAIDRIGAEDYGQDIYMVLDMDGDGKPDFVYRDAAQQTIRVYRGRCIQDAYDCGFSPSYSSWNNPGNLSVVEAVAYDGGGSHIGGGRRTFRDILDMNADGLPDLVRTTATGLEVFLNHGAGFETLPIILETGDDFISYASNPIDYTIGHEVQMIDLNGDSLPDRVEGARFHDWTTTVPNPPFGNNISRHRVPLKYYAVDLNDDLHGPYDLAGGPYLCPTDSNPEAMTLCFSGSGYALPSGWAIVPAMSVRLNTGAGFTNPLYSPSPFLFGSGGTAPRLRSTYLDNTAQRSFPYRDFIDVNGDGRVDWVTSGVPEGSNDTNWYVLYNQGDGRFGTNSLVRHSGANLPFMGAPLSDLGDVRPSETLDTGWHWLGETYHHSSSDPIGLSEQYAHIFDLDSDGVPELVTSIGMTDDRWNLRRIRYEDDEVPHTKPNLLVEMDNGLGGVTHFRYRPSTDFLTSLADTPDLPFSTWVVTGIRRTDGLCDKKIDDWFRIPKNPCLAAGHELVQRIDYTEGLFDGATREFRGFGKVVVTDGPERYAAQRHVRFYQDEYLKGRILSEETWVGGVDLLSRTTYDWRPLTSGVRTQVYLQEQRIEEFVLYSDQPAGTFEDRCVVHRNSIIGSNGLPDRQTRVHTSCSMPCDEAQTSDDLCAPRPIGKKQVDTTYADPHPDASHRIWDRPSAVVTTYVDQNHDVQLSGFAQFEYDGLVSGVDRGNLFHESHMIDQDPVAWSEKFVGHDNDSDSGVGNIVSVDVRVSGLARDPMSTEYDTDFRLYPLLNSLPATTTRSGQVVQQQRETRFDLRYGKETQAVGVHGRELGDVSGAEYDSLGRPVCEYEPGSSCSTSSTFEAMTRYAYNPGDPNAEDLIDRLNWVEVRRREPNAPNGFLVTRSYRDALGRERITTNEQFIVDPPSSEGPASMQTVVRRHFDYGPNGKVSRKFAAYLPDTSGLSLAPPPDVSAIELDYSLNGNGEGYWDPAGRPWAITQHDLGVHRENLFGSTTQKIDALGNQVLEHTDAHGRLIRREVFEGGADLIGIEEAVYNGRDQAVREWVGEDSTTEVTSSYDLIGRLVSRDDPNSGIWFARYDEAGNKVFSDDPKPNQSVQRCFDELDRVVLQCGRGSDDYDADLCSSSDPACTVEYRFHYDEIDNIESVVNLGIGQLTTVVAPDHERRWAYDVRSRITQQIDEIDGVSGTTRFDYFSDVDRLLAMVYPDGKVSRYGYDPSGQPRSLGTHTAGGWFSNLVSNIQYDLLGRVLSVARGNSTVDEYSYHGASENYRVDEIVSRVAVGSGSTAESEFLKFRHDDYDANGRLTSIEDDLVAAGPLSLSADYSFDGAGRLETVGGANPESFEYDSLGNIRSINGVTFSVDADGSGSLGPHQFDRFGDLASTHWRMSFDDNGQRTSKARSDGSMTQTYAFDAFGRLRSLSVDGITKTMRYDHSGGRISETRNGQTRRFFGSHAESAKGLLHKYYYIGDRLIATRTDPAPALSDASDLIPLPIYLPPQAYWFLMCIATMLLALPIGRSRMTVGIRVSQGRALGSALLVAALMLPIAIGLGCVEDESVRHYHLSQRSSPIAITNGSGALDRQYRYSAYGEVRRYDSIGNPTSIDPESRREFTGYQTDPESELQYANARYYDPSQAQFLSMDPEEQNASPYAYVAWDPVNFTDPSGKEAFTLAFLVFMALALVAVAVQAIITGIQTSSWSNGLSALAIGVGTLVAGTIAGMVVPGALALLPGISQQAVQGALIATGVGSSAYGASTSSDTSSAVLAGIGLALSLSGAAYALTSSSSSNTAGRVPKDNSGVAPESAGVQVAVNGSNRSTLIDQMLKILRGSAESRIIRDARVQNEIEIAALRGEATNSGTVRGRPIGDNRVVAFEVMSFTVDSAGNRSFNDSIVTVEFTPLSDPTPTQPSLIGPGNPPFVRTVVTGPHPISCRACPGPSLPR